MEVLWAIPPCPCLRIRKYSTHPRLGMDNPTLSKYAKTCDRSHHGMETLRNWKVLFFSSPLSQNPSLLPGEHCCAALPREGGGSIGSNQSFLRSMTCVKQLQQVVHAHRPLYTQVKLQYIFYMHACKPIQPFCIASTALLKVSPTPPK